MNKFAVNYKTLGDELKDKPKVFRLADVQHKLKKVAFDVVKFHDSDGLDGLWQIKQTDEGEYIVAMYDESETALVSEASSPWKAIAEDDCIHVFYKDEAVTKLSLASMGISKEDFREVASQLPDSLASNKKLVTSMLKELSDEGRKELFVSYPELQD